MTDEKEMWENSDSDTERMVELSEPWNDAAAELYFTITPQDRIKAIDELLEDMKTNNSYINESGDSIREALKNRPGNCG